MILNSIIYVYYICLFAAVTSQDVGRESRLVTIDQGPVRGYKNVGENFYSFYNIPYGSVEQRFQVAQPPPNWTEPFDAVYRGIVCPQFKIPFIDWTTKTVQEDCLVINIFVPDTNQTNLPVLFDIHGGVFHSGFGNANRFTTFSVLKNVIIVNFNYRIGLLGFLCLGTEKIPGNAGMKDQVTALRWVQRNIHNFGGNPEDITLSGCSVGGAAVDLLMISKTTRGLFKRAIPDSGSNLGSFAVQMDPIENAKERARILNFTDVNNIEAMEKFFMNVSIDDIMQIQIRTRPDTLIDNAPCVERDVGQEMFLDDSPYNILKSGDFIKYPVLYSVTDKEGSMNAAFINEWGDLLNENFANFLPGNLQFKNEEEKTEVAQIVKEFYFGNETINESTVSSFIDFQSDILFVYSVLWNIKLQVEANSNEIYLYEYSYYDENSFISGLGGAGHCAQTRGVRDENETIMSEEYRGIKALLRNVWDNFIKTNHPVIAGSPVQSWPPVGHNRSPHLSINTTSELRGPLSEERARFWDSIYEQYYRQPLRPIWQYETDSASRLINRNIYFISCILLVLNRIVSNKCFW